MQLTTSEWQFLWYAFLGMMALWAIVCNLQTRSLANNHFRSTALEALKYQKLDESIPLRSRLFDFPTFLKHPRVVFHIPAKDVGSNINHVFKIDGTEYYMGTATAVAAIAALVLDHLNHQGWTYIWVSAGLVLVSHLLCRVLKASIPNSTRRLLDEAVKRYQTAPEDKWELTDSRYAVAHPFVALEELLSKPTTTPAEYAAWFSQAMKDTILYPRCDGHWLVYTSWNIQSGIFFAEDKIKKGNGIPIDALAIIKVYAANCPDAAIRATLFTDARPTREDTAKRLVALGFKI